MNKIAKGNRIENYARDELQDAGYLVEKKNRSRYQSPDFWGLFDLIALIGPTVRLIQIKSDLSDFYKARREIKRWKKNNKVKVPCEVWLFLERKRGKNVWRIEEY